MASLYVWFSAHENFRHRLASPMLSWDLARRPYYASPSARSGREIDMAVPEEGCDARHCVRVVEAPLLLAFYGVLELP